MCPWASVKLQVFHFNRAIVRQPARSVVTGLRASDRGNPTYDGIRAEHDAYIAALRSADVDVTVLPPLENYPDSLFVEDPALVFSQGAILLRPGAPSRAAESSELAPTLRHLFDVVLELPSGHADGGDILVTPNGVMIGLSDRTDRAGAEALAACLTQLGREARIVETPQDVLHLKSACSLLDGETILCTPALAAMGIFEGFRQIVTPDGEDAAANALRVNDVVLAGAGFPRTIERLGSLGYVVVPLETSQIGKLDAGLSCMSLRWSQPSA
jgi:dimethylargininase